MTHPKLHFKERLALRLDSRQHQRPPDLEHSPNKLHPAEDIQVTPARLPDAFPRLSQVPGICGQQGGQMLPEHLWTRGSYFMSVPEHRWCWSPRFDSHDNKGSLDSCLRSRLLVRCAAATSLFTLCLHGSSQHPLARQHSHAKDAGRGG